MGGCAKARLDKTQALVLSSRALPEGTLDRDCSRAQPNVADGAGKGVDMLRKAAVCLHEYPNQLTYSDAECNSLFQQLFSAAETQVHPF